MLNSVSVGKINEMWSVQPSLCTGSTGQNVQATLTHVQSYHHGTIQSVVIN